MTTSQAKSPSAPEVIKDQLPSGGSLKAIVIDRGRALAGSGSTLSSMKHGALPVVIGGAVVATAVCAHVGLTPALILGLGTGLTLYAIGRKTRRAPVP